MCADASPRRDRDPGLGHAGLLGTGLLHQCLVDVWRIDLDALPDGVGESLDGAERARAARIVDERRRALWIRSRGALRTLLGRHLGRCPHHLRFGLGVHGKPALVDGAGRPQQLRFNLSHSGSLMLLAVSAKREVGVDVELTCPRHERYTVDLLREWTRREATAKCRGTGLAAALDEPALVPSSASGGHASAGLWTTEVDVGPHAVAALALEG
jgi:4'-phosphopantetheinyl transferase